MRRTDQERRATVRAKKAARPRRNRGALALALMTLAAPVALAACGSDDDGGGRAGRTATAPAAGATTPAPPKAPTGVDRAFAAEMIPHHEGAVAMAEIAREHGSSTFVRSLAGDVIHAQRAEIATLRQAARRLVADGVPVGDLGLTDAEMGMDHDLAMLRDADDVDRAFLEMMIPHHEGAIAMAEVELARGGDPELRRLARQIADAQKGEIETMQQRLGGEQAEPGGHDGH